MVKPSQPPQGSPHDGKKPYAKPELAIYGRLMDVTQMVSMRGGTGRRLEGRTKGTSP